MARDHDTEMTERETMETVAEQILRDHLPLHAVDQHMAAMRDLVEFKVVLHQPVDNEQKTVMMWSIDIAEATQQAASEFEHGGWHISRIARDCTECYGGQWWLDPEASPRPLPFTDEEMWGAGVRGKVNKLVGGTLHRIGHRLSRASDLCFNMANKL